MTDITEDLMNKIEEDVSSAMRRTLATSPQPMLPIALSGLAVAIGYTAAILAKIAGSYVKGEPDHDCTLLAALLGARMMGIGGPDPTGDAYKDFDALKAAGRTPDATPPGAQT